MRSSPLWSRMELNRQPPVDLRSPKQGAVHGGSLKRPGLSCVGRGVRRTRDKGRYGPRAECSYGARGCLSEGSDGQGQGSSGKASQSEPSRLASLQPAEPLSDRYTSRSHADQLEHQDKRCVLDHCSRHRQAAACPAGAEIRKFGGCHPARAAPIALHHGPALRAKWCSDAFTRADPDYCGDGVVRNGGATRADFRG